MSSAAMKAPTVMPMMPHTRVITVNWRTTVSLYVSATSAAPKAGLARTAADWAFTDGFSARMAMLGARQLGAHCCQEGRIDLRRAQSARDEIPPGVQESEGALMVHRTVSQYPIAHTQPGRDLLHTLRGGPAHDPVTGRQRPLAGEFSQRRQRVLSWIDGQRDQSQACPQIAGKLCLHSLERIDRERTARRTMGVHEGRDAHVAVRAGEGGL